ncbi:CASP-like protein [Glycine soja]|nr:CASP-like protein [Glycine soja]
MKDFPGTPGTGLGLALRISQFVFAAGSIASMATTPSFFNFTAFCSAGYGTRLGGENEIGKGDGQKGIYLIASMGLQVIWSFVLALLDAYALVKKKVLHNAVLVSLFVVGDWVTATLSLAAASSSAGITVLYFNDLGHCHFGEECQKYQISVALAFLSWFPISISSLIMLWLLAAG